MRDLFLAFKFIFYQNKLIRNFLYKSYHWLKKMKTFLLIGIVCYVAFATQYVPIPKREHGILIGNPAADVKIDLIYDPVCDGSA